MKKISTKKSVWPEPKPELKWQTGAYDRRVKFSFLLPLEFLLLCRLMDITPEEIIRDFTDNLSCGSWKRMGRDKPKEYLINYFIAHGYGQHHYSEENIRQIFKEMDAVGLLFPSDGNSKMVNLYAKWRDRHHRYWFKSWFRKPERKLSKKGGL